MRILVVLAGLAGGVALFISASALAAAYRKISLPLTDRADSLKYRLGYLFGVSKAAPDGDAIPQFEYDLHF